MPHRSFALTAACALALAACSSTGSETGAGGNGPGTEMASYAFKFKTAPGKETHWCQYARMPKPSSGEVIFTGYTWSWTNMHHWALYRTTKDLPADVALDKPFDCFAPGAMQYAAPGSFLLEGDASGSKGFPDGTGFDFAPGEVFIVQAHSLNTTGAEIEASIDFDIAVGDPAKVPNRLGLIQFYDPYIVVPAHSDAKAQMRCQIPADVTVVRSLTHEHTRGVGVKVFLDEGGKEAEAPFLESTDWQHPTQTDTVQKLPAGSYVRTVCSYHGDDKDVIQGQDKTDNEMCMYIGYYYPRLAEDKGGGLFENCVPTLVPGGVGDEYGTGTKTCSETLGCIQTCAPEDAPRPGDGRIEVGKCWQSCMVDSCRAAAAPLQTLSACVQSHCAKECAPGGDCPTCVIAHCATEYGGCQSSACGG